MSKTNSYPKVCVLLTTYNGIEWLNLQIKSILAQKKVDVTIIISDDSSSDGTLEFLLKICNTHTRIFLLPQKKFGSSGLNFYRLINDVSNQSFDYYALSDQDDIWNLDKLYSQIVFLKNNASDCVSSNVFAFSNSCKQKLIIKSQPQLKWDHFFESGGPGCTFVMTRSFFFNLKNVISLNQDLVLSIKMHDWLIYAVCRSLNCRFNIFSCPTVMYRQHDKNVFGANYGIKAKIFRVKKFFNGWYRSEVIKIVSLCFSINQDRDLESLINVLKNKNLINQFKLLPYAYQGRRRFSERLFFLLTVIFFIF